MSLVTGCVFLLFNLKGAPNVSQEMEYLFQHVRNITQPTGHLSDRWDQYSGLVTNDLNTSWKTFNNES